MGFWKGITSKQLKELIKLNKGAKDYKKYKLYGEPLKPATTYQTEYHSIEHLMKGE